MDARRRALRAGHGRGVPKLMSASLAALAMILAACSSSGGGGVTSPAAAAPTAGKSSAPAAPNSSPGGTGDAAATAQKALDAISKTSVAMTKPTQPVTPGTHKVAVIAVGLGTPGASDTAVQVQKAIKDIGWSAPPTYDGKFQPSVASGYIQTAVTNGAQGIVLVSVTPATVASSLQLAQQKKVPVVCILCGPPDTFKQFPGVIGIEPSPQKVGIAQAEYVIAKSSGNAKVWVYEDDEFPFTQSQTTAAISTLQNGCPGCQVHTVQMKAGDEQKPGIPVLAGVLASNPKGSIDYIIAPYDNAAAQFSTFLQQKGRTEIKVIGYAALPVFFDQIKAGSPPSAAATVSIPLPYMGYAAIDELAREFANKPTWNANELSVSLVTTENQSQYDPKAPWVAPGFDVASYFKKLWGK